MATGQPAKTNGKVTGVNVAKEASIGKATLYRYFRAHVDLGESYRAMRKSGIHVANDAPETIQQAYRLAKEEVKRLRSELSETKRKAEKTNKLKAHLIQILWSDNERLHNEVRRLNARVTESQGLVQITSSKN